MNEKIHKRELNPKEKQIIHLFKDIPFRTPQQKSSLILTWRKLKNASDFVLESDISETDLLKIRKALEEAGLFYKDVEFSRNGKNNIVFFFANSKNDLESISKVWFGDHHDREVYLELGRLYGYPRTAIEAFDKDSDALKEGYELKFLLTLDEMKGKIPKDIIYFNNFLLSKENWQQELKTTKKWAEEIKLVDPVLYRDKEKYKLEN